MRSGRLGFCAIDKRDIWNRWKAGQTLHEIGRVYGKCHNTIRAVLLPRDRAATHAKQVAALRKLPKWLDDDTYRREILPRLAKFTVKSIRLRLAVSHPYATLIRQGRVIPHPRHWLPLAELTGFSY